MKIYLFRSTTDTEVFGFTDDPAGINLPVDFAPWRRAGDGTAIYLGDNSVSLTGIGSSEPVMAAIKRDGYYISRSGASTANLSSIE